MAIHNETGKKEEQIAADYLAQLGYQILHSNWRFRRGEIDLIAQLGNTIVFVEVKTRTGNQWKRPEEAIDEQKRKLLAETADAYMQQCNDEVNSRFDVIAIEIIDDNPVITHHPNAITPELF